MAPVLTALLAGLLLSFVLEFIGTVPRSSVRLRRPLATVLVHIASWGALFFLFLLLFQRPWFSAFLVTCFQMLLLAVNFAKYHSLREPFLFQDFEYFWDLIRYPRLYLPFFGIWNAIGGLVAFIALFSVGLMLEAPLSGSFSLAVVLAPLSFFVARFAADKMVSNPELLPETDLAQLGMTSFFWSYYLSFSRQSDITPNPVFIDPVAASSSEAMSDIVVIQSESFFDPRLTYSCVREDVLSGFDRIKAESIQSGALKVPAWGANTVRTECAFLTGLKPDQLGIYRFNPYWYLAKNNLPNLVSTLKKRGYKTVCVHPYPEGFYMRDRVFPRLGFDRFVDISEFDPLDKDGQYISDAAVCEKVKSLMTGEAEQPLFLFVITMENHGPLHLETAKGIDLKSLYDDLPPEGCEDLTVYLRHLKNADQMLISLTDFLKPRARRSILCWYGDHVPVMSGVYKKLGEPMHDTPYLIWNSDTQSRSSGEGKNTKLAVNVLPELLLQHAVERKSDIDQAESSEGIV